MSVAEQIVLYQELAAHDAPRLVLAFVGIHHAASTLLVAGTDEQRARHLPAILDGEIWVQGFSEPEAGSDLASLRTSARKDGDGYVVNGQKLWASGGMHADWCLLLARTDPEAPKRKGISYFLLDMTTPGVEVRPIRNAIGDSHFCEIFLNDVAIPGRQPRRRGERGMAGGAGDSGRRARHDDAGTRRAARQRGVPLAGADVPRSTIPIVGRPAGAVRNRDHRTARAVPRSWWRMHEAGTAGPADASIVKLYYSELLQRMTDFGAEIGGLPAHTELAKPMSSGWESGSWMLDFIGSWEWTIPGGSSEIQRTIIAERGLGLPREPSAV